uniref:Uncharacterized protein n=1 Tax=Arundo donax TaxID=35708 RepID=A0A0A8YE17_ARUDO
MSNSLIRPGLITLTYYSCWLFF